jgi:hypothetical protein
MQEIIDALLEAPDSQLDDAAKKYIREWGDPPTALQILEVLDWCVWAAWASGFTMQVLNIMFEKALKDEKTSREEIEKKAVWRDAPPFNRS